MATKALPTKPEGDAAVQGPRGKGPAKGKGAPARKAIRGKMVLKPSVKASTDTAAKAAARRSAGVRGSQDLPDQEARPRGRSVSQYVRLRVRVDDDGLSIVGSHLVDSPLAQTAEFQGAFAYEVTDGDRLLHAGSIPDLGVFRSFAHPDGSREQLRHHTYELSTYEFDARVPAASLTRAALPQISVVLYRVKEKASARAAPARALTSAPLDVQRPRELREVGRVEGLPASVLPAALKKKTTRSSTVSGSAGRSAVKRATKKR